MALILVAGAASADVTLQNDSFASGQLADFMGGFDIGEIGASRFIAPDAGRQLMKVQLLYGGAAATRTVTLKVYDDTAGTDTPGAELSSTDFQLMASNSAMQELDITSMNVTVPQQFRVGIQFQNMGAPSIAADTDGTNTAGKNFILANGVGWTKSGTFSVPGDWIIRAVVSGASTGADAGVTPDASTTGATCTGNSQCSTGEFCDLTNHVCTFECRTNNDCAGGGTCNSLGMCVGGGGGGGGCCQSGHGGEGGTVLGLGVLALIVRRRRAA